MRALYACLFALLGWAVHAQVPDTAIIKGGNVFVTYDDGSIKQLTFTEDDHDPILLKTRNQVVFVRDMPESHYTRLQIMTVDVDSYVEEVIADEKPYKDGRDNTTEILTVNSPAISQNEEYLYFTGERAATSDVLVRLNLQTKEWEPLFPCSGFTMITTGTFAGNFAIARSEIRDEGRATYYMIVDEEGSVLKEFSDGETLNRFLESTN